MNHVIDSDERQPTDKSTKSHVFSFETGPTKEDIKYNTGYSRTFLMCSCGLRKEAPSNRVRAIMVEHRLKVIEQQLGIDVSLP